MNNIRNNALCLRCSAKAYMHYTHYDTPGLHRYRVDRAMCHSLLDNCNQIWSYMANASWAGDFLNRIKKYSGFGFDTRVKTTSLKNAELHSLWECQNNVTLCKSDNQKLDNAC
jgi:hypothetical protein